MKPINTYKEPQANIPSVIDYLKVNPIKGVLLSKPEASNTTLRCLSSILTSHTYGLYDAIELGIALCSIVQKLHQHHIIHGNITPEHIYLSEEEVFLEGFDTAHYSKNMPGQDTVFLGTPGFAAPEQYGFIRSKEQADIYAIGVLLNVAVTGCYIQNKLAPHPLRNIIRYCTHINPKKRYPSAKYLENDLKKLVHNDKLYNPYLPPGFRSHYLWKGIVAGHIYALILFIAILGMDLMNSESASKSLNIMISCLFMATSYGLLLIASNYLYVNQLFSWVRFYKVRRIWAAIIEGLLWVLLMCLVLLICYYRK